VTYAVMRRDHIEYNNDPQRRCYDGCHFSTDWYWTPWVVFDRQDTLEGANRKLKFWTELNDYAVSQRGPSAKSEYKIEELPT